MVNYGSRHLIEGQDTVFIEDLDTTLDEPKSNE